jgi:hypothetical protein
MTNETKLYAVSSGNGNDGVSHSFPDYYVRTDDPWRLARLALVGSFKSRYWDFVVDEMDVGGEEDYTISACLYEGPDGETEFGMALAIVEVFQDEGPDMSNPWHKLVYDSIEDAFSADLLALVPAD